MSAQGIYWILTIPHADFLPYLPPSTAFIRGQLESGSGTGYLHWQLLAIFKRKCRLAAVKKLFGDTCHAELSRSAAATEYVWKDDTRVEGTQFEMGSLPFRRNDPTCWESVRRLAMEGRLDDIDAGVYVQHYNSLKRISADHLVPVGIEKQVLVYWGKSGAGKSRRAWDEAGLDAYPKDPRTKFWDGYRGQPNVVIDKFRGGIDIGHMLRWLDRYPVTVEVKGSATVLRATKMWITSNLSPDDWYPDLDAETKAALRRRLTVTHFN